MDRSAGAAAAVATMDQLSVLQLSRLHDGVLQLREHLRAALLADTPQTEMLVYARLRQLYHDFLHPFFLAKAAVSPPSGAPHDTTPAVSAQMRFVLSAYTQDVLAACVYLLDTAALPSPYNAGAAPPPCEEAGDDANVSAVYVSATQRRFCGLVFLHTCWSASALPLHEVLLALYPLLDAGAVAAAESSVSTENRIAADLFALPRFASRKRLLADTLTGLVLSRGYGVRELLSVLVLNDRVADGATREAAELLVRLLTGPVPSLWQLQVSDPAEEARAPDVVVTHSAAPLSPEEQVRLLAPQLLSLLEEHADAKVAAAAGASGAPESTPKSRPRFLARLEAAQLRLPPETLEQRLHLGCTMLLNGLVRLPSRTSADFARCYRVFFHTNRLVLSPGFAALSLRRDALVDEAAVVAALRRVLTLVKGVSHGAGSAALAQVLPPTAPGVLSLCAVVCDGDDERVSTSGAAPRVSPVLDGVLRQLLRELLANPSLHAVTARALVGACGEARAHNFIASPTVASSQLEYVADACPRERLLAGLQGVLLGTATAEAGDRAEFVHTCVEVLIETCQQELFAAGMESVTAHEPRRLTEATPVGPAPAVQRGAPVDEAELCPPLPLLERLALEAPPEALFGRRDASLESAVELLGRVMGLSGVLYRWALGVLEHLVAPGSLDAHLACVAGGSPLDESRRRRLLRLQRCCRGAAVAVAHLIDPSQSRGTWPAVVADDALQSLATRVGTLLEACVTRVDKELRECHGDGGAPEQGEVVTAVRVEWQHTTQRLHAALDSRAAVDVAVLLTDLSRRVDDVVFEVRNPQPLYPTAQPLLRALVRVLYETDDVGAAVRAVHCVAWLGMYRFDAHDSAYIAELLWTTLAQERPPSWLAAVTGYGAATQAAAAPRLCRLRVRLLDVLLSWTDYDEEGRTLRNVDDAMRRAQQTSLYDVLVARCHNSQDVFVQVAALHLVGSYALAMQPRVPISAMCDLCRDVFRLSPHEMAKAACAAALGKIVAALGEPADATALVLSELDLGTLQTLASAMSSYRGRPPPPAAAVVASLPARDGGGAAQSPVSGCGAEVDMHDAVIQQHGRDMLKLLREASRCLSRAAASEALTIASPPMPTLRRD